ncbi:MAG: FAD-binding oxidoreductase [Reichenbachiella sp.]
MKDFLIIGHGLAGAILSHDLLDQGHSITVIDNPQNNHSSTVAGGLYNPVTGRKMIKSWMTDELFPLIEPTYRRLEKKLDATFLHPIGIYRPFVNVEEQNDWEGKSTDEKFKPFIKSIIKEKTPQIDLNDDFGGIHLKVSGYVNVPEFLLASKTFLAKEGFYQEEDFIESELEINSSHISYRNEEYRRLIFCNGIKALESNLFHWVPLRPVKGEVLKGKMDKTIQTIYNRGVFVLPFQKHLVRIGSNYQNQFEDLEPTEKAKNEILEKLSKLTSEPIKIVDAIAGIRPATKDRRPIIGKHPDYEHIYMFNGFGSKGVSLVPYFSQNLLMHLDSNIDIHPEVNLNRYYKLYSKI